jgi:hypothetical protein
MSLSRKRYASSKTENRRFRAGKERTLYRNHILRPWRTRAEFRNQPCRTPRRSERSLPSCGRNQSHLSPSRKGRKEEVMLFISWRSWRLCEKPGLLCFRALDHPHRRNLRGRTRLGEVEARRRALRTFVPWHLRVLRGFRLVVAAEGRTTPSMAKTLSGFFLVLAGQEVRSVGRGGF